MSAVIETLRPRDRAAPAQRADEQAGLRLARGAAMMSAFAGALLAGVQRTTELNWQALRLLLAAPQSSDWRAQADRVVQSWRMSWRTYQVCSVTASDVLELVRAQVDADSDDLWRVLQQLAPADGPAAEQTAQMHAALQQVQSSFATYLQSVLALQRELATLARGDE